jgi:hypothetical protein
MHGRRKGQFFLAGALMLCVMFFLGLPMSNVSSTDYTSDLSYLAENLESEIPRSLNLVLLGGDDPERLGEFSDFIRSRTGDRYMEMDLLWVVLVPDTEDPDVEVYAGNWLGRPEPVTVTLDGAEEVLDTNDREISSVEFYGLGSEYVLEVSFDGRAWSDTFTRDKTSLYAYIMLSRGENSIVRDICG